MNWVYTNRIEFGDGTTKISTTTHTTEAIQIYIRADKYETVNLRRAVLDKITFYFLCHRNYYPTKDCLDLAFKLLPSSSGSCRLFTDILIYRWRPKDEEATLKYTDNLPVDTMGCILYPHISQKLGQQPNYWDNRCSYHKHGGGKTCRFEDLHEVSWKS